MSSGKPTPQVFAIMRNGHEVLRSAMADCAAALKEKDESKAYEKFAEEYSAFKQWQQIHGSMEEGKEGIGQGMFPLLDKEEGNIATEKGLYNLHSKMHNLEKEVDAALASKDMNAIKEKYKVFAAENDAHLVAEEAIMMPKVQAMKKRGVPLKKVMATDILPIAVTADFEFFLSYAMQKLEKVSGENPRARVFAHAIQAAATEEQWKEWIKIIKSGLSDEAFKAISDELEW